MHLFFLIFIITINSNVFAENLEPNTYYDFIVLDNNKYFTITSENSIMVYDKNQKKIEYFLYSQYTVLCRWSELLRQDTLKVPLKQLVFSSL